jgi:RimJ/RimL family protein N-acetyltransferase
MIAAPAGEYTEIVAQYVMEKTGMSLQPGSYQAMMVISDKDDFVAGIVISNFRGTDCEISCATETSAAWRPSVLRAIFSYIFNQLNCVRCTSITTKQNKAARTFLEGLGFVLEGNLRLGYDGFKDALIYGLLAKECRYLSENNGESLNGKEVRTKGPSGSRSRSNSTSASGPEQGQRDHASELEPN